MIGQFDKDINDHTLSNKKTAKKTYMISVRNDNGESKLPRFFQKLLYRSSRFKGQQNFII